MALNDEERFEALEKILDEIQEMSDTHVLLVEGKKDVRAIHNLDLDMDIICVQRDGGPLRSAEMLSGVGKQGIILTDWDDRGNRLADDLAHHLSALCVKYDLDIRDRLRDICIKDIKDVESLDSLYRRLQNSNTV